MQPSASSSTMSASSNLFYGFRPRRLLLHTPPFSSGDKAMPPSTNRGHSSVERHIGENNFDANIVIILSLLLCAMICVLGLNSLIRCVLRRSSRAALNSADSSSTRLVNTGVKKKALKMFPTVKYSADLKLPGLNAECSICLSEFTVGEWLRVLPKCDHGFHLRCIDKWLISHSSCPTCRHCLNDTCQKIVGCSQASSSNRSAPSQSRIVALEPEGLIRDYRARC